MLGFFCGREHRKSSVQENRQTDPTECTEFNRLLSNLWQQGLWRRQTLYCLSICEEQWRSGGWGNLSIWRKGKWTSCLVISVQVGQEENIRKIHCIQSLHWMQNLSVLHQCCPYSTHHFIVVWFSGSCFYAYEGCANHSTYNTVMHHEILLWIRDVIEDMRADFQLQISPSHFTAWDDVQKHRHGGVTLQSVECYGFESWCSEGRLKSPSLVTLSFIGKAVQVPSWMLCC